MLIIIQYRSMKYFSKFFCPLLNISLQLDPLFETIDHSPLVLLKYPIQQ